MFKVLFLPLLGVAMIVAGIILIVQTTSKKTKGVLLSGKVTGYKEENGYFFPIIAFMYNNTDYSISADGSKKQKYQINQTVEIYFNPEDTYGVYIKGDNEAMKNAAWFLVIGIAFLVYSACKYLFL